MSTIVSNAKNSHVTQLIGSRGILGVEDRVRRGDTKFANYGALRKSEHETMPLSTGVFRHKVVP